jgi:hypothetical protein
MIVRRSASRRATRFAVQEPLLQGAIQAAGAGLGPRLVAVQESQLQRHRFVTHPDG